MTDRVITIVLSSAVTFGLMRADPPPPRELDVDRLIVRKELIVSDTGTPWEAGYEEHQIPRGIYAKSVGEGVGGLWVRSRIIKGEIDDPFDDRFHAIERDGSLRRAPGHISWNLWLDGAWRQVAIVQGEALERSEVPQHRFSGATHPGRIRFQTYRPGHQEPLTDALIGQGMMSLGGGGYGGGGLPYPTKVLQLWGGALESMPMAKPDPPVVVKHDDTEPHEYQIVAVSPQGDRSAASDAAKTAGRAELQWDSVPGADSYVVVRDGREITGLLRLEGAQKRWTDSTAP